MRVVDLDADTHVYVIPACNIPQAYVEKSRILDKVNDIVKGGGAAR